jgi:hypothetical protein
MSRLSWVRVREGEECIRPTASGHRRPDVLCLLPAKRLTIWEMRLMSSLAINIDRLWRDIETLATFNAGGKGVNRLTFSKEDRAARAYLRAQMAAAGLEVGEIPPGVMLEHLTPPSSAGPVVLSGSHIDAVPAAGRFDGMVGVMEAYGLKAADLARRAQSLCGGILRAGAGRTGRQRAVGRGSGAGRVDWGSTICSGNTCDCAP